jgi:CDP-diacylglycerol--glycerol-3-phosphate 3-phosphatidyltransferase
MWPASVLGRSRRRGVSYGGPMQRLLITRSAYLAEWARLHGDYDAASSPIVRGWLELAYAVAKPVARLGVGPTALTLSAIPAAGLAVWSAGAGRGWVLLAVLATVATALADTLDGAVAVLTGRASRFGFVLDSLVDRLVDAMYVLSLWRLGASAVLCVCGGFAGWLLEYARARAMGAGMREIGLVTVGERPVRVTLTVLGLLAAVVVPGHAPGAATAGASAILAVSAIACAQFLVSASGHLRGDLM